MKSDMLIHTDVVAELAWDPKIEQKEVEVAVNDGVVTLSGTVASYAEKIAAERAVERVRGVRAVANDLNVSIASDVAKTDTQIAHAVADALSWAIEVPDDHIKASVANGWVTLEGQVDWQYQRQAAVNTVTALKGVRGLSNQIVVAAPGVSVVDVKASIKQALERRADHTADHVVVEAKDGVVTLSGTVASYADRRAIAGAAWSAPGVSDVRDDIAVSL